MRALRPILLASLVAASIASGSAHGAGAGATTTVSMTVASQTNLSTTGCASGSATTTFGTILPGTSDLTDAPCVVTFGSSNDTALLRLHQQDRNGAAMYAPTAGALQTGGSFASGVSTAAARAGAQDQYAGLAIDAQGRIYQASGNVIARYLPTGALDTAGWGTAGFATITLGGSTPDIKRMEVQSNGKLVFVGDVFGGGADWDGVIARLTTTGGLDGTFGTGGYVVRDLAPTLPDSLTDLHSYADGSLVVLGTYTDGTGYDTWVDRMTVDGQLDTTFGVGGSFDNSAATSKMVSLSDEELPFLTVQSTGRILILQHDEADATVTGLTRIGTLDTTFGTAGRRFINHATDYTQWTSIEVDDQDRVLIEASGFSEDSSIFRLTANGGTDGSFGGGTGRYVASLAGSSHSWGDGGIVTDSTGAIYVGGDATFGASTLMWIGKVKPDGSGLDTTFGSNGFRTLNFGASIESFRGGLRWSDGALLIGGRGPGTSGDMTLGKLALGGTIADYGGAATWASAAGQSMFGVCVESVANATPIWTEAVGANACTKADAAHWRAVPPVGDATSRVASTASNVTTGQVDLVFGVKVADTTVRGAYVAPLTFDLVAPAL